MPARSGHDVKLTLDRDVQWYTQRTLRNAVESVRGDSGSAVVMDTDTGELLALADYPTFDANAPSKSPDKDLGTRALRDVYEPGSVEKVLTTSALLDENLKKSKEIEEARIQSAIEKAMKHRDAQASGGAPAEA